MFGPKPGLMPMTNRDVFAVSWQGGGGLGDPLDREIAAVATDVASGLVSIDAARVIYGVVVAHGNVDTDASTTLRQSLRKQRLAAKSKTVTAPAGRSGIARDAETVGHIGESLRLVRSGGQIHVVSDAGAVLSSGTTKWRDGAHKITRDQPAKEHCILLHEQLALTTYYCPISGAQLAVDIHRKDEQPSHDVVLDMRAVNAS